MSRLDGKVITVQMLRDVLNNPVFSGTEVVLLACSVDENNLRPMVRATARAYAVTEKDSAADVDVDEFIMCVVLHTTE